MCLLKVYVDEGKSGKKLVAEQIALVIKENDNIKLKNLDFEETKLDNVQILSIDTLNSVLTLKSKET
jgi:pectate lyase